MRNSFRWGAVLSSAALFAACGELPTQAGLSPDGETNQKKGPAAVAPASSHVPVILYGAENGLGKGDFYEIDVIGGTATRILAFTPDPNEDQFSPNGLAFDAGSNRLYFSVTQGGQSTNLSNIYYFNVNAPVVTQVAGFPGRIYNADIWSGGYYFVANDTRDVQRLNLATQTISTVCSDVGPAGAGWAFGDVAIRDGVMYGSARQGVGVPGEPVYFFEIDLGSCAENFAPQGSGPMFQLAWGADGALYGHETVGGPFGTVDATSGAFTPLASPFIDGLNGRLFLSDLAPGFRGGICEGGVDEFTVRYTGTTPLSGTVRGQRRNPQPSGILDAQTSVVSGETHYRFAVTSRSGQFSAVANGRLANNFKLFINGSEIVDFHTSCSAPIYPGMTLGPSDRQFTIVSVHSVSGGWVGAQ
jgi:hypothetical protein